MVDGRFFGHFLVARRATYVVDGRFFGHCILEGGGDSAHTHYFPCGSRVAPVHCN